MAMRTRAAATRTTVAAATSLIGNGQPVDQHQEGLREAAQGSWQRAPQNDERLHEAAEGSWQRAPQNDEGLHEAAQNRSQRDAITPSR